jgi:hypothetical protein
MEEPPQLLGQEFFVDGRSYESMNQSPSEPADIEDAFDEALNRHHSRKSFFDEHPPQALVGPALHPRDLESFFDQIIGSPRNLRGQGRGNGFGSMRAGSPPEEIFMMSGEYPKAATSISASTLRSLFPGPGLMVQEDMSPSALPFGSPDIAVMDMLQQMDETFSRDLLPLAHRAASAGRTPDSCGPELREYCRRAPSQLHCLGQNSDRISDKCREDVGKSVPFICSSAIDKFCNLLDKGILDCLGGHVEDLDDSCRDSVLATRHVVARANTQRATVTDLVSGTRKVNIPGKKQSSEARVGAGFSKTQSPQQREAPGDAKLNRSMASPIDPQRQDAQVAADMLTTSSLSKAELPRAVEQVMEGNSTSELEHRNVSSNAGADDLALKGGTMPTPSYKVTHKDNLHSGTKGNSETWAMAFSEGSTMVCLLLTATVSLVLLRSQNFGKMLATSQDPDHSAGLPLVRPCIYVKSSPVAQYSSRAVH